MSLQKFQFETDQNHEGRRLDHCLYEFLSHVSLSFPISKSKVRKLIVIGSVYLNHRRVRIASKVLKKKAKVEVWLDPQKIESTNTTDVSSYLEPEILYEDEDIIVVNKPSGIPTQPAVHDAKNNMLYVLKTFLKKRDQKEPYLAIHHRLDKETSGVLLFAKQKRANAALAESFSKDKLEKHYEAITFKHKNVVGRWSISNVLSQKDRYKKRQRWGSTQGKGKQAFTVFECIHQKKHFVWWKAYPQTGRTHQVRVHLFEAGFPIVGDSLYFTHRTHDFSRKMGATRLMLHARSLKINHPITGKTLKIEAEVPQAFHSVWQWHEQRGFEP